MNKLLIGVPISLVAILGFLTASLAGETSATMEKIKGETKALVEEGKGQTKGVIKSLSVP